MCPQAGQPQRAEDTAQSGSLVHASQERGCVLCVCGGPRLAVLRLPKVARCLSLPPSNVTPRRQLVVVGSCVMMLHNNQSPVCQVLKTTHIFFLTLKFLCQLGWLCSGGG